jgi:hypothetical protein
MTPEKLKEFVEDLRSAAKNGQQSDSINYDNGISDGLKMAANMLEEKIKIHES